MIAERSIKSFGGLMIAAKCLVIVGMLALTGCSAGEAVVDGFYGGIADTIAGIVSETLLQIGGF